VTLIDLSHPLGENTPLFPGDAPLSLTPCKTHEADGYNAFTLSTGLHAGTHLDAPLHLLPQGKGVEDYPLARFHGRGVLLDARGQAVVHMRADYEDLVRPGDAVLLYTGFDVWFMADPARYFGAHPVIDEAFCDFLLRRGAGLLGLDTPSPDRAPFPLHRKLLAGEVFLLENLTNLGALAGGPPFEVLALPLRLKAEASLVRAVAFRGQTGMRDD
jgi:kynurenine formamidase